MSENDSNIEEPPGQPVPPDVPTQDYKTDEEPGQHTDDIDEYVEETPEEAEATDAKDDETASDPDDDYEEDDEP